MTARYILPAPAGRAALVRGMGLMTRLLRPTLGPLARTVAIAPLVGQRPPEILDSAATIARRTIGLGDPFEQMGATIVRHLVWRVHEQVGDGTATAAVLTQALVERAHTYLTAGGEPVAVRRGIERGLAAVQEALRQQARTIDEREEIAAVVAGIVREPGLAKLVGSVVEGVGPDGWLQVEEANGTESTVEYLEGVRWHEGYLSPFLVPTGETTVRLLEPRILITDYHLETAEQLVQVLESCRAAGVRSLFVIAPELRDSAVAVLVLNRERGVLDGVVAARAPLFGDQRAGVLEDLAALTGAHSIRHDRADRLANVTVDDLGSARQVWVTQTDFGILHPRGERDERRLRIAEVRAELQRTPADEVWTRERLHERIGKLSGLAAVVKIGAAVPSERDELKLRVEAAIRTARAAVQDGVVPGGGAALLRCAPAIDALDLAGDERVGAQLVACALAEPMRTLLRNAGLEPAPLVDTARRAATGRVFDVERRDWVDCWQAGPLDALPVVQAGLEAAVSAATVVLTSDVLIHNPDAPVSVEP